MKNNYRKINARYLILLLILNSLIFLIPSQLIQGNITSIEESRSDLVENPVSNPLQAKTLTNEMDLGINNNGSFVGEASDDRSGYKVSSAGDVNGDGYDDIIIGAYTRNSNTGEAYLIFGNGSEWSMDGLLASADASFIGENADDQSGFSNRRCLFQPTGQPGSHHHIWREFLDLFSLPLRQCAPPPRVWIPC